MQTVYEQQQQMFGIIQRFLGPRHTLLAYCHQFGGLAGLVVARWSRPT